MVDVADARAAEAAIDDGQIGKRLRRLPIADAGATDEQDRVFSKCVLAIPFFEGGDFRFEAC